VGAAPGQYFERSPSSASRPSSVTLALDDVTLALRTDRGVFSSSAVDAGTRYLLLDAPRPTGSARNLLDLGCGYGPITCALAARAPEAIVWGVDVNERALALCAANAAGAGQTNVRVGTDVDEDIRFDAIYSNPPIRIGKPALHALLERWLARLVDDGHAYLVVQKHLGSDSLARWLDEHGWHTDRLGSRAGYRILDVTRAAPA
jgi:16S rRNA (guanine1207-N2)-methyltransferase